MFANLETGYTGGVYHHSEPPDPARDRHIFLYEQYHRLAGLLILDRRRHVTPVTWEQHDRRTGPRWRETAPFWSVSYWWTHRNHRRKGIATRLVSVATHYLGTRLDQLGVSHPLTEDGGTSPMPCFPIKCVLRTDRGFSTSVIDPAAPVRASCQCGCGV